MEYYKCYIDVASEGFGLLDAFIRDYYDFIKELGDIISLDDFAKEWDCIPHEVFGNHLHQGAVVYMRLKDPKTGELNWHEVITTSDPVYRTNDGRFGVTVALRHSIYPNPDDNEFICFSNEADLYLSPRTTRHTLNEYRLIYRNTMSSKGETKLCPIRLITTKTKAQ